MNLFTELCVTQWTVMKWTVADGSASVAFAHILLQAFRPDMYAKIVYAETEQFAPKDLFVWKCWAYMASISWEESKRPQLGLCWLVCCHLADDGHFGLMWLYCELSFGGYSAEVVRQTTLTTNKGLLLYFCVFLSVLFSPKRKCSLLKDKTTWPKWHAYSLPCLLGMKIW